METRLGERRGRPPPLMSPAVHGHNRACRSNPGARSKEGCREPSSDGVGCVKTGFAAVWTERRALALDLRDRGERHQQPRANQDAVVPEDNDERNVWRYKPPCGLGVSTTLHINKTDSSFVLKISPRVEKKEKKTHIHMFSDAGE